MAVMFARRPELLLGRKTYEIFAAYWPHADEPGADDLNNARKYVVSRTLDKVDWNNSILIKGDVVKEITRLKELDGPELQAVFRALHSSLGWTPQQAAAVLLDLGLRQAVPNGGTQPADADAPAGNMILCTASKAAVLLEQQKARAALLRTTGQHIEAVCGLLR